MSQQVFRVITFCINTRFQSFSTLLNGKVHHHVPRVFVQPMSQQAAAASLNMLVSIHALLL